MEWLKVIRRRLHISQAAAAEMANLSQPSYCNIENGKRRPSVDVAKRIATVLGFEWTRFYESSDDTAKEACL